MTQGTDKLLSLYGKPEYDHGSTCLSGISTAPSCIEIYVYDADANAGAGDLRCASCNPTGLAATADADFFRVFAGGATHDTSHISHPLSDGGHYVFFDSEEQLVPDDQNSSTDVYEFDTVTEQTHLLSSGTGANRQNLPGRLR